MANSKSKSVKGDTLQATKSAENAKKVQNNNKMKTHLIISICTLMLSILIASLFTNRPESISCPSVVREIPEKKPVYWLYSAHSNVENKAGIMKHVHLVLNRLGLEQGNNLSNWDLLWSHDYPFRTLHQQMRGLRPDQLVNHFPGTGYITNKVDFATMPSTYVPKAFKLPQDKDAFIEYAASKPDAMFVSKDNQHRGVVLENVQDINITQEGKFVQEYIQRPFLVDGHKFDIGVYTVITSVNPLRLYIYKGDVLFRFCPAKYYPFDPLDLDKYVIADDYLPLWEVPSLAPLYTAMGYGMKDSFEAYVRKQGKDPSIIWKQIEDFLRERLLDSEHHIISGLKNYGNGFNFFEMMRFDFVIDEDLRLYALEANMSPNLSSAHYPPNQLLYEQVLYSLLPLVGVGRYTHSPTLGDNRNRDPGLSAMRASDKNIIVFSHLCGGADCMESCEGICVVCKHCLAPRTKAMLAKAYVEHINRNDCKRVFPPPMVQGADMPPSLLEQMSPSNRLMYIWFQGKCNNDITFCT